ncbi:hypothetical protein Tco_1296480 [Tanacetum coccineum]
MVAEALQVTILNACDRGLFKGVCLANSGKNISLLQFADDALFFGEWSSANASNLINIPRCLEMGPGLKINLDKSCLFGVGIPVSEVISVASSLGCAHGTIPFMYLGLSVGRRMRLIDGWQGIINRLRDRLSLWEAKSLSVRGRLTLIKSVLGSLPIYYLSLFKAPLSVIKTLEAIRCNFFWGHKDNNPRINWVKWNSILLDPKLGGLGVGCLQSMNLSLLCKWKWRFLTKEEGLWRTIIKEFYGDDRGFDSHSKFKGGSGVWTDIIKAIKKTEVVDPNFKNSFIRKVADGENTSFWHDAWCGDGTRLKDKFPMLFSLDSSNDWDVLWTSYTL